MADTMFRLGTFRLAHARPFVGIVVGTRVLELGAGEAAYRGAHGGEIGLHAHDMVALLGDWDRNFEVMREIVAHFFEGDKDLGPVMGSVHDLGDLRTLAPVQHPSKILNAAANYSGHLAEMQTYTRTGGLDAANVYKGDKATSRPYLFLKAPSSLTGAFDDIVLPSPDDSVDWEVELAAVIGVKAKKVSAAKALEHVAGWMTFNDVSCRNRLFRDDRQNFRTDWMSSKSLDTFAPCGPFLVPRAFVPDHVNLRIELKVNGEIKQEGLAGDMIYSPEEQIEYASSTMTLMPGDIFATGTVGGVGQAGGTFLKAGDIVEAHVKGLGAQRNKVVASPA